MNYAEASKRIRAMNEIEMELRTLEIIRASMQHLDSDQIRELLPLLDLNAATAALARTDCKTWWEGVEAGVEKQRYGTLSGKWLPLEVALEWKDSNNA